MSEKILVKVYAMFIKFKSYEQTELSPVKINWIWWKLGKQRNKVLYNIELKREIKLNRYSLCQTKLEIQKLSEKL